MPRGENTILRENGKPEPIWSRIVGYNASDEDKQKKKQEHVGQTFQADGHTYEVEEVRIDTIHRLIAIGKLMQ